MTEEGKDVSFTTASGKAVTFKSKPRAKKEVVATPVETEPEAPVRIKKPRAPKAPEAAPEAAPPAAPEPAEPAAPEAAAPAAPEPPAPEPVVPDEPAARPGGHPAAPEPPPEPSIALGGSGSIPAPDEPPVSVVAAPKLKAKRKPRAQPGIGKIPPKQGVDPPPEPPPLERQDAAFPPMSSEDFGMLFGNYLHAQQMNRRATKHELYRSWVGL